MKRRIKLIRQDGRQVIHIPIGWELPGDEATISKQGNRLFIEAEPKRTDGLIAWLATLEPLTEEDMLPEIDDRPAKPFKL